MEYEMVLQMQKRGALSHAEKSDLGSYRLYTEFIDRNGVRVWGEVYRGCFIKNGKRVSENLLFTSFQYEDVDGVRRYPLDAGKLEYCSESVLKLINSVSRAYYTDVKIVTEWKEIVYPEYVEKARRSNENWIHIQKYRMAADAVYENYACIARDYSYLTPDEYSRLVFFAFGNAFARHHGDYAYRLICREYFRNQKVVNPAENKELLSFIIGMYPEARSYLQSV